MVEFPNFTVFASSRYVVGHVREIEHDMNSIASIKKRERKDAMQRGVRRRRSELTKTPRSLCIAYLAPSKVVFDA